MGCLLWEAVGYVVRRGMSMGRAMNRRADIVVGVEGVGMLLGGNMEMMLLNDSVR